MKSLWKKCSARVFFFFYFVKEKVHVEYLEEKPSQGGLDGLTLCLNLQEQQAVKILIILAAFEGFNVTT